MYCPYCQTTLVDDAVFCSSCGKNVKGTPNIPQTETINQQMQQYQARKDAVRNAELASLKNLMQHFSKKQATYDLYDDACKKLSHYAKGVKSAPMVFGCILTSFGLLAGLYCVLYLCATLLWPTSESYLTGSRYSDHIEIMCSGLVALIPGIILITVWVINKVKNTKKRKFYQEQYASLASELTNHYLDYPNCPIGPEYTNPRILVKLQQLIISGRADTIKESINHLLADADQRALNRYLDEIQRNTAAINRNICFGNAFIAPGFFK